MFQNCSMTKTVKNTESSYGVMPCPNQASMPRSAATNTMPTPTMERIIGRVMMKSLFLRGFSRMTLRLGGSEASASAANVSMIRLTHSICVTVSGSWLPNIDPSSTMTIATKLIVSWNRTKR